MRDSFRDLVIHQAKTHQQWLESWQSQVPQDKLSAFIDALVHDGLWLSKFPLHCQPQYGVSRLDALDKARWSGFDTENQRVEAALLRPLIDADLLRFVLSLNEARLQERVEIFYGGRAMNKPLWNYLLAWFDRSVVLRSRIGEAPLLFDTVYRG